MCVACVGLMLAVVGGLFSLFVVCVLCGVRVLCGVAALCGM